MMQLMIYILLLFSTHANDNAHTRNKKNIGDIRFKRYGNSKMSQINAKHMPLARVSNGVNLLLKLIDGFVDTDDAIVELYRLKSKTTLNDVAKMGKLDNSLQLLENNANAVPLNSVSENDMTGVINVFSLFPQVNNNQQIMGAAAAFKTPGFISDSTMMLDVSALCGDPISSVYNYMIFLETKSRYPSRSARDFNMYLTGLRDFLSVTKKDVISGFLNTPVTDRSLEQVVVGLKAAESLTTLATDIGALPNQLATIGTAFDGFKSFLDPKLKPELEKILRSWTDVLQQWSIPTQKLSAPAFMTDRKVGVVSEDVRSASVQQLLGARKDMADAIEAFDQFGIVVDSFGGVFNMLRSEKSAALLVRLTAFIQSLSEFQVESPKFDASMQKLQNPCLTITVPAAKTSNAELFSFTSQFDDLSTKLQIFVSGFDQVVANADFQSSMAIFDALQLSASTTTTDTFDAWKKSKDFLDVKKFLVSLNDTMGVWKIDKALAATLKDQTKVRGWIDEAKQWLASITVVNTCTFVPEDTAPLVAFSKFVGDVDRVKGERLLAKMDEVRQRANETVQAVEKVRQAGEVLKEDEAAKAVAEKLKGQADNLLTIATAIGSFGQLAQLHTMKEEMVVIRIGQDTINTAIDQVADPEVKKQLQAVWSDFATLESQLKKMEEKVDELEKSLTVQPERELKQLGAVYQQAAKVHFTGKFDIRRFGRTMRHFAGTSDQQMQLIITSFQNLAPASFVDLDLAHASFQQAPKALVALQAALQSIPAESEDEEKSGGLWVFIGIVAGVIALAAVFFGLVLVCKKFVCKKKEKPFIEPIYVCDVKEWRWNYVQMQDMRFDFNQKDPITKNTPLYDAVIRRDWPRVRALLDQGALVDVLCGPRYRTALSELVLMIDQEHARWLLEAGADIIQPDGDGDCPDTWADHNGFHFLFDEFDCVKGKQRRRTLPKLPRFFKILVLDAKLLSKSKKRKLPIRIRDKIEWGYTPGADINQYTHIVVAEKNVTKVRTLLLEEDDVFIWKCVAAMGVLMDPIWFDAIFEDPDKIGHEENQMLQHIQFNGRVHEDALFKMKNEIHMGRPGFLTNAAIFFLPTNDQKALAKRKEWEEVITMLNGTLATVIVPDDDKCQLPYNSLYAWYRKYLDSQNRCWIVKYGDSKIDPVWRSDVEKYSLVPFRFITECIARFYILPADNTIVPLDFEPKKKKDVVEVSAKAAKKSMRSKRAAK